LTQLLGIIGGRARIHCGGRKLSSSSANWLAVTNCHLLVRGKTKHQTVVAIGRELLGFIWAIASVVKVTSHQPAAA
jgi:hypothetical protein